MRVTRILLSLLLGLPLSLASLVAQEGLGLSFGTGGEANLGMTPGAQASQGLSLSIDARARYGLGSYGNEYLHTGLSPYLTAGVSFVSGGTEILGTMSAASDGKYGAALADIPGGNTYGFYFLLDEGGLRQRLGNLRLELGRFRSHDEVESPYSLFVNSLGISTTTMAMDFDDGRFFYRSRWLGLNLDSNSGTAAVLSSDWGHSFPNRGATVKSYGMRLGELRFGFQDSVVYAGRWMDFEYFLSPLPLYFTQYVRGTGGAPWVTNYDDNELMGFFLEWRRPGEFSLYGQFLLDDFGLGEFLPSWPKNPWQIAASAGGRLETAYGSFGAYTAMATKYTYEPSNATVASDAYGYTYYPETQFTSYWQDTASTVTSAIAIEDNEIGYKYGENNLALQLDWRGRALGLDLGGAVEFRLSGSNSPANPGHDDPKVESNGTKWLDDAVLEKRFLASLAAAKEIGQWRFYGILTGGLALDALELRASTAYSGFGNGTSIYSPVSGNTKLLFGLTLGGRLSLGKAR